MQLIEKINKFWNNQDLRTRKINRNVIYSFGVKGGGIIVSLMMVPVTLKYLSEYEYGIWLTIFSILNWINYFDMGLGNGLRNKLAESIANNDMRKGRIYVSSTFALLSIVAIILCVVALLSSHYIDWNRFLNVDKSVSNLREVINIVIICVCANFVLKTVGVIHLSFQNAWINNFLTFLGSLLAFIWVFILYKTSVPSLMKVAIAVSVSPLIVYILAYPLTFYKKYTDIAPCLSSVRIVEALSLGGLGIKFFLLQLSCLVIFSTSNIIISKVFSPADVTPYNIAYKYFNVVVMIFTIIINPLWTAITDAYARKDYMWIQKSINKMVKIWCLTIVVSVLLILSSKFVFKLWIGSEVNITYSLSIAVAIYMSVFMWTNLFSSYVNGVGHLNTALITMIAAAVVFIPIAIPMSKWIGIIGIPYSMAFVLLIPCAFLTLQYKKEILENVNKK